MQQVSSLALAISNTTMNEYELIANSKSFRDVIYTFTRKIFIFGHIFFFPGVLKYI